MLIPTIKVLDDVGDDPIKVSLVQKEKDGPLWWYRTPTIPELVTSPYSAVAVAPQVFKDIEYAYTFTQVFFNVLMYNKLHLSRPTKVLIDGNTFYYHIDVGESIVIPVLPTTPQIKVSFTLHEGEPVLKIYKTKSS